MLKVAVALLLAVVVRRLYVRWEISQRPLYPPTEST